jgi:hypothetical protein
MKMKYVFCIAALTSLLFISGTAIAQDDKSFPVPPNNPNQLFYLQRTSNTNTIVCELNYKDGQVDSDDPVHVFWIRYGDKGQKAELSFLQRNFAYGVDTKLLSKDNYQLHFVSYKKRKMYLQKSANNQYYVYTAINNRQAILKRIFIKINGGSFWSPNIEYVELKGTDPATGSEVVERIKV